MWGSIHDGRKAKVIFASELFVKYNTYGKINIINYQLKTTSIAQEPRKCINMG